MSQGKGKVGGGSVGGDADKLTKLQGKAWILSPSKTPLYCCQVKLIKAALLRLRHVSVFPLSPRGKIINKQLLSGNQQLFASSYREMAAVLIVKCISFFAAELRAAQYAAAICIGAAHEKKSLQPLYFTALAAEWKCCWQDANLQGIQ